MTNRHHCSSTFTFGFNGLMDCRRSAAVTCVLYCIVCVCVTHTVVSDPLQGVAQVEIKTPVVCSRFTRLQALLERHNMAASGLRLFKKNLKINNEVFYLQVRNTLCYLVLGLQDEAVVNFGEAVAGGNRQNLWEKHRCQTTNHRQACVSGNSSAYSTHTPPRTPSWRPCCLLATGGRRPGRSSD